MTQNLCGTILSKRFRPLDTKQFKCMKVNLVIQRLLWLFMKATLIPFFLIICLAGIVSAHTSSAQDILEKRITIKMENAQIKDMLSKITEITNVKFMYSSQVIQAKRRAAINVKDQRLEQVLQEFLTPLNITYEVNKKTIILNIKTDQGSGAMQLIPLPNLKQASKIDLKGKVKDEKGVGLPGVNIILKGTQTGTTTDADGNYTLAISQNTGILVYSFLGYKTQESEIGNRTVIDVNLAFDDKSLDEVVVVGFGLANKKATISGAISTVNAEELSHSSAATATGALVGKAPGINFRQTSGKPGSEPTLQIRNYGTPLIIIDGVQKDYSSFSQLDFNDIENVSVLKDASASIYGMQAANGVVVVTTKRGKRNQKPMVTFQGYYGVQNPTGYNKPADAATYLKAIIQDETYNNVSDAARTVTKEEYNKWVNQSDENHKSFDWYNYVWQTTPQAYGNVNISGGSENMDYYVSVGNITQKSMLRNFNGFNRTNFQSAINANVSKKLKIGLNIMGRMERIDQPGLPGDDYDFALNAAFRNLPTKRPFANNNPDYPAISSIDPQYSYGWIGKERSGEYVAENRVVQLNGSAEYDIVKGLKARALVSYWFKNTKTDLQEKAPVLYAYNGTTDKYSVAYQGSARYMERNMQNSEEITSNFQLDYNNNFAKHNLHLVGGIETKSGNYPRLYVLGNPEADGIKGLNIKSVTTLTDDISFDQKRLGVIGRFNYDYDNKYIVELSGRYDGSYFYKAGKRFGFFPSGSVAYRVSQENFWQQNTFLNSTVSDLKLRGSYGVLGKELGTALSYITGYNFNQGSAILDGKDVVSSRVTGLATDNITWGRVYVLDFGIDASFLSNRLSAGFDWFNRHQTGELASRYDVLLPNEVGFTLPSENLNGDHTRGLEFSLNWKDNIKDFTYSFGGNFTFSRWITGERYKPHWANSYSEYRDLGNTTGRFRDGTFQLVANGQFQSWEQIANYPVDQDHYGNTTIRPGDYMYEDVNHDGFITELDMKNVTYRVNNGTPWINFAFNFAAAWKGVDFRADFVGATGYTYEQQSYMRYFDGNANISQYLADNSTWYNDIWNKNSGFQIGKYPLLTKGVNNWMNTHWPNSKWQTNVTYAKLRNLEIGYTFPASQLSRLKISNFRVYLSAQNLLTFSNMPGGLDPEITSNSGMSYPNPKLINVGFSVKF